MQPPQTIWVQGVRRCAGIFTAWFECEMKDELSLDCFDGRLMLSISSAEL